MATKAKRQKVELIENLDVKVTAMIPRQWRMVLQQHSISIPDVIRKAVEAKFTELEKSK